MTDRENRASAVSIYGDHLAQMEAVLADLMKRIELIRADMKEKKRHGSC